MIPPSSRNGCLNCPASKIYAKQLCAKCYVRDRAHRRFLNPEYKKKYNARIRRWTRENAGKVSKQRHVRYLANAVKNRAAARDRILGKGATDYFVATLAKQDGLCAICGKPPKKPCLDHDHISGEWRGVLCDWCNRKILGVARDDETLLRNAANYLQFWKRGPN